MNRQQTIKIGLFLTVALLSCALFAQYSSAAFVDNGQRIQTVYDCGPLKTPNGIYTLNQSIKATKTCLNITARNITVNCGGRTVNYSYSTAAAGYGVYSNRNYTTIQNCLVKEGAAATNAKYAIYLIRAFNATIYNNTIKTIGTNGFGIVVTTAGTSDRIYMNNITTTGATGYGIELTAAVSKHNVSYNKIRTSNTNAYGIYLLTNANKNQIGFNQIWTTNTNSYAIYLNTNAKNSVYNNTMITTGPLAHDMYLNLEGNSSISGNRLNSSQGLGFEIYGTSRAHYNHTISSTNLVEGRPLNYTFNQQDIAYNNVNFRQYGQVIFAYCRRINITGSNFSGDGLHLFFTNYSLIQKNNISSLKGFGIQLFQNAKYNTIRNNRIFGNYSYAHAIMLSTLANRNNVFNNTIVTNSNTEYGIYLTATCLYNNITGNSIKTINANSHGIYALTNINNTAIGSNNITTTGNPAYGIYLSGTLERNSITNNRIKTTNTNGYGIYVTATARRNIINNNTISTLGSTAYGLALGTNVRNSTVTNNIVKTANANGHGIYLTTNVNYTLIANNNISTLGTPAYGIYLTASIYGSNISYNKVRTANTNSQAIYLLTNANRNLISFNQVWTLNTNSYGLYLNTNNRNKAYNNTISAKGSLAYSIYLNAETNSTFFNNKLNTTQGITLQIIGTTKNHYLHNITPTNLAGGKPINFTFNQQNKAYKNVDFRKYGEVIFAYCSKINITSSYIANDGLQLYFVNSSLIQGNNISTRKSWALQLYQQSQYNNIRGNTVFTNFTGGYGIMLSTQAHNNRVTNNTIITKSSSSYGIYLTAICRYNNISNNIIKTSTANSHGIYGLTSVNYTFVDNNNISTLGLTAYGIYMTSTIAGSNIRNNKVRTANTNGYGIYLNSIIRNNLVKNNTIVTLGNTGYGIDITTGCKNNSLIDNIIKTTNANGHGVYISTNVNLTLMENNNISTTGTPAYGIYATTTIDKNTFRNNQIRTSNTNSYAVYLITTIKNNIFSRNKIFTTGGTAYGLYLRGGTKNNSFGGMLIKTTAAASNALYIYDNRNNFTISDSIINASANAVADVFIRAGVQEGIYNFINTTYVDKTWSAGANGTLQTSNYMDIVAKLQGFGVANVNASVFDVSKTKVGSGLTNINGSIRNVILYSRQTPTATTYFGKHNLTLTKPRFKTYSNATLNMSQNRLVNVNLNTTDHAPYASNINLNSSDRTNTSVRSLSCFGMLRDSDLDNINLTFTWYKNNKVNLSYKYYELANGTAFIQSLSPGNLTIGDNWSCALKLTDGILSSAQQNSTKVRIRDAMAPTVSLTYPINNAGQAGNFSMFKYVVSSEGSVTSCKIVIDGNQKGIQYNVTREIEHSFSISGEPAGAHRWTVNCTSNKKTGSSLRQTWYVIPASQFGGQTTNLNIITVNNITNLILQKPRYGIIRMTQVVDLTGGADLNKYVTIARNVVSIDTIHLVQLNKSATITLYNLTYQYPVILKDGHYCSECTVSTYDKNITFNVMHFSSYSVSENSILRVRDSAETNQILPGHRADFYANYTDIQTGLPIADGICNIGFSNVTQGMDYYGPEGLYQFNRTFDESMVYKYSVNCSSEGHASLVVADHIGISELTGPSGPDSVEIVRSERGPINASGKVATAYPGNVSQMVVKTRTLTKSWQGYYGNFTEMLALGTGPNTSMYKWEIVQPKGEIYASRNFDVNFATINCTNSTEVLAEESYLGQLSDDPDSLSHTFNSTTHPIFFVGNMRIDANRCKGTQLYINSAAQNHTTNEVLLSDAASNIVYTALINPGEIGFDSKSHDFQMIVGDNGHDTEAGTLYYLFVEIT